MCSVPGQPGRTQHTAHMCVEELSGESLAFASRSHNLMLDQFFLSVHCQVRLFRRGPTLS